ncbi:MAG: hypothetical protein WD851_17865 [Pirellulales bacterium]
MLNTCRWIALIPILLGCGDAEPELVPVRGRIMLQQKPVTEVIVNFAPVGNTAGSGALGATDKEGRFELTDVRGQKGAHPGDYKIHLYPASRPKQNDVPTDVVSVGGGGISSIYIDPNNTPLRANVPPAGGHVDVALTSDGKDATTTTSPLSDQ